MLHTRILTILWLSLVFGLSACQTTPTSTQATPTSEVTRSSASLRTDPPDAFPIVTPFFTILYSRNNNIAYHVGYLLKADQLRGVRVQRANAFHADPVLKSRGLKAIAPGIYEASGWDRGHLAPAGDFAYSPAASRATFTMANMAPQAPGLNQTSWRLLEERVRTWACKEGQLAVITGPILEPGLPMMEKGPVPIPRRFFKVILDTTPPKKAIGFIFSQTDVDGQAYKRLATSVDKVEQATGFNFFPELDPREEKFIESQFRLADWQEVPCQ